MSVSIVLSLFCLIAANNFVTVSSANILGLFTTPFQAQLVVETFLMKALALKGHNVSQYFGLCLSDMLVENSYETMTRFFFQS